MRQRIRLSESDLHRIVKETVTQIISENQELEEGWFGDKWNQTKSAVKAATANKGESLGTRFNRAKKNWNTMGNYNELNNVRTELINIVKKYNLDVNKPLKDIIGSEDENDNFYGALNQRKNSQKSVVSRGEKGKLKM